MKRFLFPAAATLALLLAACGGSSSETTTNVPVASASAASSANTEKHYTSTDGFVDYDLSTHGLPVVLKGPKGARIIDDTVSHQVSLYAGKYFSYSIGEFKNSDESAQNFLVSSKRIALDKEANPDFVKFLDEGSNSFMRENKGDLGNTFLVVLPTKEENHYYALDSGMLGEIAPEPLGNFTPADIKTQYEAAKMARPK